MKKILISILLILTSLTLSSQDIKDDKQTIIKQLELKSVYFKQPKFIIDNKFKKNISFIDNLLYPQLETNKIKYVRCERKDYDITYNYILDTNDICICVILEIESSDILENIIMCKENEIGVERFGDGWIQKGPKETIYYKLTNTKTHWLFIKW